MWTVEWTIPRIHAAHIQKTYYMARPTWFSGIRGIIALHLHECTNTHSHAHIPAVHRAHWKIKCRSDWRICFRLFVTSFCFFFFVCSFLAWALDAAMEVSPWHSDRIGQRETEHCPCNFVPWMAETTRYTWTPNSRDAAQKFAGKFRAHCMHMKLELGCIGTIFVCVFATADILQYQLWYNNVVWRNRACEADR